MSVNEVLDLVKKAQLSPQAVDQIAKAYTQAMSPNLNAYDLEAPAKKMVPALTPLRNMTPRVKSNNGDTATRWKAITAINTGRLHGAVSEGARGGIITDTVEDRTAAYVGIGLENSVTFEAEYASESFDDVKARAVESLLLASILTEEEMLIGGNGTNGVALGTTPTPTVAVVAGGSITAATYKVICVALGYEGYRRSSVSSTGIPGTAGVISQDDALGNAVTFNVGAAAQSAASADATTETTNLSITASVTPVRGAVAYAWYLGTAGNEKIAAITTINSVKLTALPDSGNQAATAAPAADKSKQSGVYEGFLYTAFLPANNAQYTALATGTAGTGTVLTADGKGGVVQINDMLGQFWDNLQLQPTAMWTNRQQVNDITDKCVGTATSPFRFNVNGGKPQGSLVGGGKVSEYQSPIDASIIPINIHPKMPPGMILFTTDKIPYALNNVGNVFQVKARRDWYQIEWPMRTRKYEYGVYQDTVFQHYFPPSLGLITNIAAG